MRNNVIGIYQSGIDYKAISKALRLQRTSLKAIIHKLQRNGQVLKLPRSAQLTKNQHKSTATALSGGHKTPNTIKRTDVQTCLA